MHGSCMHIHLPVYYANLPSLNSKQKVAGVQEQEKLLTSLRKELHVDMNQHAVSLSVLQTCLFAICMLSYTLPDQLNLSCTSLHLSCT